MFRTKRMSNQSLVKYSTAADFVELYNEEMRSLFLLSILLTADAERAEQCFVGALEECLNGFGVSIEWADLWARRVILKHAIMLVKPVPAVPNCRSRRGHHWNSKRNGDNMVDALLTLATFDRFVFVMSLLERQSDQDCSVLLSCNRCDVESARARALRWLADAGTDFNSFEVALHAGRIIPA
jgi:hypothetical protein